MVSLTIDNGEPVPSYDIFIDPNRPESINFLIKKLRPEWQIDEVQQKILSGGLTNMLRAVRELDEDDTIVVKIYGECTDVIIDREAEKYHTNLLGRHGIGPPLLALFANGICYQYIPGVVVNIDNVRDPEIVEPTIRSIAHLHSITSENIAGEDQYVWSLIMSFIEGAKDELSERVDLQLPSYNELLEDVMYLKTHLSSSSTDTVLCHNDLLLSNFVYRQEIHKVTIIDHEYMGYNFQAFDIANHFCEYPGASSDMDFSSYPSEEYQVPWIRKYLQEYRKRKGLISDITLDEVKQFYLEVQRFVPVCHFLWSVWSMYQSFNSKCEFDYLQYAKLKYQEFQKRKHRCGTNSFD